MRAGEHPVRRGDRAVEGALGRSARPGPARSHGLQTPARVAARSDRSPRAPLEMLWQSSNGNPFYLTELARFGADHGQLELKAGVWWWTGGIGDAAPARRAAATPDRRPAGGAPGGGRRARPGRAAAVRDPRVGGQSEDAIMALDRHQIVTSDEQDGVLLLRFSHPLLHAVAERQLSATRRRALSRRLREAPADHVDMVRRATWEDAGGGAPNVELLLAAADAVLINDPAAALRLASGRSRPTDSVLVGDRPSSAAQSELGRPDLARATLERPSGLDRQRRRPADLRRRGPQPGVVGRARPAARLGDRRPAARRAARRRPTPCSAAEAVVRLFTGGCVEVIALARQILDSDPDPQLADPRADLPDRGAGLRGPRQRGDRRRTAVARRALPETRVSATRTGLAYALVAVTGVFYGVEYQLPRPVGTSGRWPGEPEQLAGPTVISAAGGSDGEAGFVDRSRLALPRRAPAAFPRRPGRCGGAAARGLRAAAVRGPGCSGPRRRRSW